MVYGIRLAIGSSNFKAMLTLILFVTGLICFYLIYKSIDFFEKI